MSETEPWPLEALPPLPDGAIGWNVYSGPDLEGAYHFVAFSGDGGKVEQCGEQLAADIEAMLRERE
jgi:hypothetical protein